MLFEEYLVNGNVDLGRELLSELNNSRNRKWINTVQQMDFKHSSRKAWSLLKKPGCVPQTKAPPNKVSANDVASRLVLNSKQSIPKARVKTVRKELKLKRAALSTDPSYSGTFSMEELDRAIQDLKIRKSPGFDNMLAEFIKHFGVASKNWILNFFNLILETGHIRKAFKRTKIITVLKPGKDGSDSSHYRPISLLSIVYKLLERIIINRI